MASFLSLRGGAWARDERGSMVVMAALLVPVLLLASLGTTTIMMALAKKKEVTAIAQTVCNRMVKPLLSVQTSDADRQAKGNTMLSDMLAERNFDVETKTATAVWNVAGWTDGAVQVVVRIPVVSGFGQQVALKARATENCRGIPPYPKLNDVILSSNFKSPNGLPVSMLNGTWGVYTPQQVTWDGGTGWGVEIQDWTNGFELVGDGVKHRLPAGVTNPFVVELDSGTLPGQAPPTALASCGIKWPGFNSSMYKNVELHPGTYRLSMWFRARAPKSSILERPIPNTNTTNKVVVYLEGTKPVSAKKAVIVWDDYDAIWRRRYYDIKVDSYGLYKLLVAAEGCSDSYGGLFNDLQLAYIQRPYPEYNDPLPSAPSTN